MTIKIEAMLAQAAEAGKPLKRWKQTDSNSGWSSTKRTSDSQRQKVYDAEDVLRKHHNRLTEAQAQTLLKRITDSAYVKRNYGVLRPTLEVSKRLKRRSYARGDFLIRLAPHMVTDHIVIHEAAHLYTKADPGHDWLFCIVYMDLVRKFMGADAHAALKASFKRYKVRRAVPRKRREMSPEAKLAASERMAKARAARGMTSVEPHVFAVFTAYNNRWSLVKSVNKWGQIKLTHYIDEGLTRKSDAGVAKMFATVKAELWNDQRVVAVPASAVSGFGAWGRIDSDWDPEAALLGQAAAS